VKLLDLLDRRILNRRAYEKEVFRPGPADPASLTASNRRAFLLLTLMDSFIARGVGQQAAMDKAFEWMKSKEFTVDDLKGGGNQWMVMDDKR
jgi:hypothetical protein